jgi:ubiquinone/menaquinone biosynthesis C-methylase UbiE
MPLNSNAFRYGTTPTLLLDDRDVVLAINGAFRELLGSAVGGVIDESVRTLIDNLGNTLEGDLVPNSPDSEPGPNTAMGPHLTRIRSSSCHIVTERHGNAELRSRRVPCFDPAKGNRIGSLVDVEILDLDQDAAFERALATRLEHQLMWELYAISYDRIQLLLPMYLEVRDRHLARMRAIGGGRILDVGAGTGNVAIPLLESGFSVTAVDVCHPMLERLLRKMTPELRERLTVVEDTAEHLRLNDASFDGVTAMLAFFDMDSPRAALAEAARLLRPGGSFVATDPKSTFNVTTLMSHAKRALQKQGKFPELSEDWYRIENAAPYLDDRIHSDRVSGRPGTRTTWSAENLATMLQDYGFQQIRRTNSHFDNCETVEATKP